MKAVPLETAPDARSPQVGGDPAPSVHSSPESSAETAREGVRRRRRLLVGAAVLIGVLLRVMQYAVGRSLWFDEALLSSSILGRDLAGLFRPLDYGQTAPFGFLAVEKLATLVGGAGEYALRFPPLLAGLAALLLFPAVARRYASRPAAPLAVAVFALTPFLVYYSSEVKQYAFDALVSVAVLFLAFEAARPAPRPRALLLLALVGMIGVWLSQPAVFMLGGAGIALGAQALRSGDRRRILAVAAIGAGWLASFALAYAASRAALADPAYMRAFWRAGFFPLPPTSAEELAWLPRQLARAFREPMGIMGKHDGAISWIGAAAGLATFLAGCWFAWRRYPLRLAILVLPLGLVLVASALKLYPFGGAYLSGGRVLVFLVPTFALLMAEGAVAVRRWVRGESGGYAFAALAAAILLPGAAYAALSVPHVRAEAKPLLEYAAENRQPGDVMYVYYGGRAAFEYYAPRYGFDAPGAAIVGACARNEPAGYLRELEGLRGRGRVWVLFIGEGIGREAYDERRLMVSYLEHVGRRLDDRVSLGASVYLYDLREGAGKPGPFQAQIPVFADDDPGEGCRGAWGPK